MDFTKIKLTDIEGEPLKDVNIHKTIADRIYKFTEKMDMIDIAIKINRGDVVDLRDSEVAEIIRIVNSKEVGFMAFVKKSILDFIDIVKKEEKSSNSKT